MLRKGNAMRIFHALILLFLSSVSTFSLTSGDYHYRINPEVTNTCTITDYIGYDTTVNIPATIEGLAVTVIGDRAFAHNNNILEVSVPEGVVTFEYDAFASCKNLRKIALPESLETMGVYSLTGCESLEAVVIPDKVESLPYGVFSNCLSLWSVTLGEGLVSIGTFALSRCTALTNLTIPKNVRYISSTAFGSSISLQIEIDPENVMFDVVDGVLFSENKSILLWSPKTKTGAYVVPEGTELIGSEAFSECEGISSIGLPNTLTNIGYYVFDGCKGLSNLDIPESVTLLGPKAFYGCQNLTNITLSSSITSIERRTFYQCRNLGHITIPSAVESIEDEAFKYCSSLTGIYFYGDAPLAGVDVFSGCDDAVVYYTEGSEGWGSEYASLPTAVWNPSISTENSFGVSPDGFGLTISGAESELVKVEASTNLLEGTWDHLETLSLSGGSGSINDPGWTNNTKRFYRLNMP